MLRSNYKLFIYIWARKQQLSINLKKCILTEIERSACCRSLNYANSRIFKAWRVETPKYFEYSDSRIFRVWRLQNIQSMETPEYLEYGDSRIF